MGAFGERMQREREMRNITLDEIATSSKISARMLRALEEEDFDKLPGGIFNKGFVRSYARYLGIDEEQALTDYVVALKTRQQSATPGATANEPELLPAIYAAKKRQQAAPERDQAAGFMAAAVILVVLLGVGGFVYRFFDARGSAANAAESAQPSEAAVAKAASRPVMAEAIQDAVQSPTVTPSVTGGPTTNAGQATASPEIATNRNDAAASQAPVAKETAGAEIPIRVTLHAKESSWVQITSDGKVMLEGNLAAETQKSFRAAKELVVRLGNAGGVEISYNGKPMSPFGPEVKMKTLTFTPESTKP